MSNAHHEVPVAYNEEIRSYAPGSSDRTKLREALAHLKGQTMDIPMMIDGQEIRTDNLISIHPPAETSHCLGHFHMGSANHVSDAIDAAMRARDAWAAMPWQDRVAIFLKAADLVTGPHRYAMNAATMLCQSKNVYQAEIEAVAELADFFRYNAQYITEIYAEQPESVPGVWNRVDYRPLEGFVFAVTPFNFTAIAANLPASAAMMGNTVVWKPSDTQVYSAWMTMQILREAGLPDGVINLVYCDGPEAGEVALKHRDLGGVHFTGSTKTFQYMWKTIGENIANYRSYPRIVGETGGKDFVFAHPDCDVEGLNVALCRGAFEYQGQKCSAASRAYIPKSIWPQLKTMLVDTVKTMKMGPTDDFSNFINAVIDERSFDKIKGYIDQAKGDNIDVLIGGGCDKSKGYFVEPTILITKDPKYRTMVEEIFGPVLTIYVYDDQDFESVFDLVDDCEYALTGAIFARDRADIEYMTSRLENAAGNFYVNDKPTGAIVGQQPFGGGRASGTNDKAGSKWNLMRWVSIRTIKEVAVSPKDYRYPFLSKD